MKLTLSFILTIVFAVGLVAFGFTFYQSSVERQKLSNDLEMRLSEAGKELFACKLPGSPFLLDNRSYTDSLIARYNLTGILIYGDSGRLYGNNSAKQFESYTKSYLSGSAADENISGAYFKANGNRIYQLVHLIPATGSQKSALVLYADAGYVDAQIKSIWFRNFISWFIQAFLVSVITLLLIRWGIFRQVNRIVSWAKAVRSGKPFQLKPVPRLDFLDPLHREMENFVKDMNEAKASAREEALLRSNNEAIWTPERLKVEMENLLDGRKMVVVSNREPYMHIHEGKEIKCIVPASGMITAMEPILKACSGLWIASGTGDADRETVDGGDKVEVPPEEPKYTLRRLWLTKEEETHYYYGFSNEGLWPLCHIAHTRPTFRNDDWNFYKKVNEDFANAVLEETADDEEPFILIQDFHFALLPELIKRSKPKARVAIFWHIPWPNPESFGICPWQREILTGMLGADLIGFHTQYHCNHFLETVNSAIESRVMWDNFSVKKSGRTTLVKPFPISIAFTLRDYDSTSTKIRPSDLLTPFGFSSEYVGIGVDRLDYTKGIVEKFLSIERFFEKYPQYVGKFTFVQIGAPTRTLLKSYTDTIQAIENESHRINNRFKYRNWKAILLLKRHHSHEEIAPFYKSADLCMVTSLHDGMNLVAKEYVASRDRNDGVLILSRFAGASQELQGAIIINPYDIEKSADAIMTALIMNKNEQSQRMLQMRMVVVKHNIYAWASTLVRTMTTIV